MRPSRFGIFWIDKGMIENFPSIVRQLMNDIIIVDARYRMDSNSIVYMGISDMFDEAPECEFAPEYILEFNVNGGVRAVRIT